MLGFFLRNSLLFIFSCQAAVCQELYFERRDMETPSRECYNIFQDSKGFIWFSSYQGFCRYDGTNTIVYDVKNGLPESAVYAASEDRWGRIWILTAKSRILYIEGGKVHEPDFSKEFSQKKELTAANFAHSMKLADGGKKIVINTLYNTYLINPENGEINTFSPSNPSTNFVLELKEYHDHLIQVSPSSPDQKEKIDIRILNERQTICFPNVDIDRNHVPKVSYTLNTKDYYLFSYANSLFKVSKKDSRLTKVSFPGRVISLYKDADQGIWAGIMGHGVFYFQDGNIETAPVHSLPEYSVSGILEDNEGNTWVSTLDKGIFFCRNKSLISYHNWKELNRPGTLLSAIGSTVYFSAESSDLYSIKETRVASVSLPTPIPEAITDIAEYNGKLYIGNKGVSLRTDPGFRQASTITREKTKKKLSSLKLRKEKDALFSCLNNYVFKINNSSPSCEDFIKAPISIRIRDFIYLSSGQWLLGENSLFLYNENGEQLREIPGISNQISRMFRTSKGSVLITTIGGGLFLYNNETVISLNKQFAIHPSAIFDITEDKKGWIWLATNQGLIKLDPVTGIHTTFDTDDGLISNEIHKLLICDDRLFLSTVEGLCSVPVEMLNRRTVPPVLRLSAILINGTTSVKKLADPIHYTQNNLLFRFSILYFTSANVSLHYQLIHNQDTLFSKRINGGELELQNLPPGTYSLLVTASNKEGFKSAPVHLTFEISNPYWKTWPFLALILVMTGLALYVIIRLITLRIKKKEEEKTRIHQLIANSQLSALQAQMNPHFVFNSINSIQNFILKKDVSQAYDYLTKFSKLIRLVLQNSRKKEISIHEDLEVLRLYVTLEQLRFDHAFEYHEEISHTVDIHNTLIPPMLIQPHIENAIWHGIMPLEGLRKGRILLQIDLDRDTVIIIIEDNGAGRKPNEENSQHESLSIKVTEERLRIVNSLYKNKKSDFEVIDLTDKDGYPAGTRVRLRIPIEKDEL